ncbi:MAG: low molecular weight protein-tyrosine-phosphatase [Planctomycetota bacterium]|jgi:protein-tyrosine phosphatase
MSETARTSVLFVCMGNICRSPLAEGLFRHRARERGVADRFDVDSAGTGGWHEGHPPDHRMIEVAAEHGVALTGAARPVQPGDLHRFDHILCADRENLAHLLDFGAEPERTRLLLSCDPSTNVIDVPDPYYGGRDGFEETYRLVDSACGHLLDQLLAGDA